MTMELDKLSSEYAYEVLKETEKYEVLRDLDIFVLDNSIRESTVAQLKGHTLENKWQIFNEVKKCGFNNYIVASFSHMTRVDDVFVKQLVERGEDRNGLFAFSEITEGAKNKVPDIETVPVGIRKVKEAGLWNVIFEIDLGDGVYDFKKFPIEKMCALLEKWITWCHDHLYEKSKVLVNFRDPPDTMPYHPERIFQVVEFLAKLPDRIRPFGMMLEEPKGQSLPEECGAWNKYIRKVMDANNWKGHLLFHAHEKYGYCDAAALQALMSGSNGIWGSICIEGASIGNASTCVAVMNLIRLGNKKVLKQYNCTYLRQAAINVTRITTGADPHVKQPLYGARALDFIFDLKREEFDLAAFFGEKAPVRITSLASDEMIRTQLVTMFGEEPQFTIDLAHKMKELMLDDLKNNRKEEYMSVFGIAMLFDRAGGKLTENMREVITQMETKKPHEIKLLNDVREIWNIWDLKDEVQGDDMLEYDSFYNGFMAPYFACYRCSDTKMALQAIDMDADGQVDWSEFLVYLKWAIHEYPDIADVQELLDVAFRKGLIPAMRDELINGQNQ